MTTNQLSTPPFRFGLTNVQRQSVPLPQLGPPQSTRTSSFPETYGNFSPGTSRFRNPMESLKASQFSYKLDSQALPLPPASSSSEPKNQAATSVTMTSELPDLCRCQRPPSLILCTTCGYTFSGRVRSHCCAHPSQIYLMDNDSCPECQSTCLREYAVTAN